MRSPWVPLPDATLLHDRMQARLWGVFVMCRKAEYCESRDLRKSSTTKLRNSICRFRPPSPKHRFNCLRNMSPNMSPNPSTHEKGTHSNVMFARPAASKHDAKSSLLTSPSVIAQSFKSIQWLGYAHAHGRLIKLAYERTEPTGIRREIKRIIVRAREKRLKQTSKRDNAQQVPIVLKRALPRRTGCPGNHHQRYFWGGLTVFRQLCIGSWCRWNPSKG